MSDDKSDNKESNQETPVEKKIGADGSLDSEIDDGLSVVEQFAEEIGDVDPEDDLDIDLTPLDDDALEGLGGLDDFDDENIEDDASFDDEVGVDGTAPAKPVKKKSSLGKLAAPLAVLLLAGGVAGYIVMNPDLIGGDSNSSSSVQIAATPEAQAPVRIQPVAVPVPEEMAAAIPEAVEEIFEDDGIAPRAPEEDEGDDFFFEADVEEVVDNMAVSAVAEEAMPEEPLMPDFGVEPETPFEDLGVEQEMDFVESEEVPDEMPSAEDVNVQEEAALIEPAASDDSPVASVDEDDIVFPDEGALLDEKQKNAQDLYETSFSNSISDKTVIGDDIEVEQPPAKQVYFDSSTQIPTNVARATAVGPRKVDPVTEPAQKYIVVNKTHDKSDPEALLASANRALKLQRYDAAVEMFADLYSKNDRDPRVLMGRAVALQHAGRGQEAMLAYEDLLSVAPDNREAVINLLGLLREEYPSVALRRLMDLQEQFPEDAMIAAQLGVTHADLGHYEEAVQSIGRAMAIAPNNAQHILNMAIIEDRKGNKGRAVTYYEKALQVDAVYGNSRSISREVVYDRLSRLRR